MTDIPPEEIEAHRLISEAYPRQPPERPRVPKSPEEVARETYQYYQLLSTHRPLDPWEAHELRALGAFVAGPGPVAVTIRCTGNDGRCRRQLARVHASNCGPLLVIVESLSLHETTVRTDGIRKGRTPALVLDLVKHPAEGRQLKDLAVSCRRHGSGQLDRGDVARAWERFKVLGARQDIPVTFIAE